MSIPLGHVVSGFLACLGFLQVSARVDAGVVADRSTLTSLLKPGAVSEDFEKFNEPNDQALTLQVATLDSTTNTNGQGPGLVVPGIRIATTGQFLHWDGANANFVGPATRNMLGRNANISITFTQPTQAFGLDLFAFTGYGDTAHATVYASDGTTVLYTSGVLNLLTSGQPTFFGYVDAAGVGKVSFQSTGTYYWSPLIDNLTFGNTTAVPEPSTWIGALLCVPALLVARRRRQAPSD